MRIAPGALVAALSMIAAVPVVAGECSEAATQREAGACERARLEAARVSMDDAYRASSAELAPGPREALRRARKAWLAWRAAACESIALAERLGAMPASRVAIAGGEARVCRHPRRAARAAPQRCGSVRSFANRSRTRSRSRTRWTRSPSTITSAPRGRVL